MLFNNLSDDQIRSICREKLESLEYWLRRLINETLSPIYGSNYIEYRDSHGNYLIKTETRRKIKERLTVEAGRYSRPIDAALLDNCIDIICHPNFYRDHFKLMLDEAFPEGNFEARTFFERLITPRNHLSHANPISLRQAERVICYSNDIIDSIKSYYLRNNMHMQYNVPTIIKFSDSFGNVFFRSQMNGNHMSGVELYFHEKPIFFLRPGDVLSIEIEVDQSFAESEYEIVWSFGGYRGKKVVHQIKNGDVAEHFLISCDVIQNKDWHRHGGRWDDRLSIMYKVLPPE